MTKISTLFFFFIQLSLLSMLQNAQAEMEFTIPPYLNMENRNHVTLRFQPKTTQKMSITLAFKNKVTNQESQRLVDQVFTNQEVHSIPIPEVDHCRTVMHYRFQSANSLFEIDRGALVLPCPEEDVRIGFMADTQIKSEKGQSRAQSLAQVIFEKKKSEPFSLLINAGDIVQEGDDLFQWVNYFQTVSLYSQNNYMIAAVGNHDYRGEETEDGLPPLFKQFFRSHVSNDLGYASIELGRLTILVLNSNFNFISDKRKAEQFEWLEKRLQDNQKRNIPVFITMHHSPFSSSPEWLRSIPRTLRNEFVPIIEKYSVVKMVLSGHLHMYERSVKNGITYLVAGPSGGIYNVQSYINPHKVFILPWVTTFSLLKIQGKTLTVDTYSEKNTLVESFTISI